MKYTGPFASLCPYRVLAPSGDSASASSRVRASVAAFSTAGTSFAVQMESTYAAGLAAGGPTDASFSASIGRTVHGTQDASPIENTIIDGVRNLRIIVSWPSFWAPRGLCRWL